MFSSTFARLFVPGRQATPAAALLAAALLAAPAGAERPLPRGAAVDAPFQSAAGVAAAVGRLPESELPPSVSLRVTVPWADVELAPGLFDWDGLDRTVRGAREARLPLVVVLTGPGPTGVGVPVRDGVELERWLSFVQGAVERVGDAALTWQVWDRANDAGSWGRPPSVPEYAFLLKKTAIAIRAADPAARVAQGALEASVSFQEDLFDEGVAPFLDAYGAVAGRGDDAERTMELLERVVADRDPGAALWLRRPTPTEWAAAGLGNAYWDLLLRAREDGHQLTSFEWPGTPEAARALATYARAFPLDTAAAVEGSRRLVTFDGAEVEHSRHVVASDLSQRVIYRPAEGERAGEAVARLRDASAEGVRVHDPAGEHDGELAGAFAVTDKGYVRARVPLAPRPLVLEFRRAVDQEALAEDQRVSGERRWTVEEVLARHLEVQAASERRLDSWSSKLVTSMQYRLGTANQPVNVRVEGRYYRGPDGTVEVENERFFLNGAPFDSKRPPELPLLQPEKVTVVPLEVHLDRSYAYRLEGRDQVGGRPAFRVSFEPLPDSEGAGPRQAGTVWIDTQSFQKLRLRAADTSLEPPLLSNEQTDFYAPVVDAAGVEHWLVQRSEISRSVLLIGATVQIFMRLEFDAHRVNDPGFESELSEAHASENQMLRETPEGFRYLRSDGAGGRVPAEEQSRKLFFVAGARYDEAFDGVVPLAGVNWLDYDLGGKGLQLNLFAAGAINTISLSDPSLFGTNVEGGFDAFLPAIRRRDRLRLPGEDVDDLQETRVWRPELEIAVNTPIGAFGKLGGGLGVAYERWEDGDDTDPDFLVPEDSLVWTGSLWGEVNRKGWRGRAWVEHSKRSDWEAWGPDGGTAPGSEYFQPGDDSYWRWGARLTKDWLLSALQRFDLQLDYYGGSGLDRFSQYEFGGIAGPQIAGFSGSGIHFDQAAIAHLGWGVDVAGLFGLRLQADYGRLRNRELPSAVEAAFGSGSSAAGLGVTGTVPGPWGTFVTFDVGWAAWSDDYSEAEGNVVAQVLFWKFLK